MTPLLGQPSSASSVISSPGPREGIGFFTSSKDRKDLLPVCSKQVTATLNLNQIIDNQAI